MEEIWSWLQQYIFKYLVPPKSIEIIDIVQVIILAYIIYNIILWVKNTRAYTLLKGILFITVFIIVAKIFNMSALLWIIQNLSFVAITALVIIFQPELRKALEKMGHKNPISSLFSLKGFTNGENERFTDATITQILRSVAEMSENKTGALIVIEEDVKLDEVVETGIEIDAYVTSQLLTNIFERNTPLHDGAAIIRDDRIIAATCYLPLTENNTLSKSLGTRHRAGVGITEISDCLAIIVSEETGKISYAHEGMLYTALSVSDLREVLHEHQTIALDSQKRKEKKIRVEKTVK